MMPHGTRVYLPKLRALATVLERTPHLQPHEHLVLVDCGDLRVVRELDLLDLTVRETKAA